MKKYIKILSLIFLLFAVNACDLDLNLQENPNTSTTDKARIPFLLNSVQSNFVSLFNGFNGSSMRYSRMEYQFGDYTGEASDFDGLWMNYYANILVDIRTLTDVASNETDNFNYYVGVAKVLEAYSTVMMVDMFGNIPYTEAVQNTDIPNPNYDNGEDIYPLIFTLIDEAISALSDNSSIPIETDLYYEGDVSKWIKLANTLKLKMYVQTRLYDEVASKNGINELLAGGNLINDPEDDFQFTYGTSISSPDTRHPYYSANYNNSGASNYLSNSFMYALKGNNDPRLRYYFYRQSSIDPSGAYLTCTLPADPPYYYCYIGDGYWGRDHGIQAGIPGDGQFRTTWGLYPAGGEFDNDGFDAADSGDGSGGAGIAPIMLSSFVNFLKAEAALTISGVSGNATGLFETAINQSINKVKSFVISSTITGGLEPDQEAIDGFIQASVDEFNDAESEDEKMEILMKQYWIALRGNGIEAYNNYRRTGKPFLQSPQTGGTTFPRSILYPSASVNSNPNATQHSIIEQVFWDTNPAEGFID